MGAEGLSDPETAAPLRVLHLHPGGATELAAPPPELPAEGFVWISCTRTQLRSQLGQIQAALAALAGQPLVDLHVSDLLNEQLPSHYDYTAQYDLLVFRRLASAPTPAPAPGAPARARGTPPALRAPQTLPMGFALYDRVLLSVHPEDCSVRAAYLSRLLSAQPTDPREARSGPSSGPSSGPFAGVRLPASPADLMLRLVNLIVDGFLGLRRELSRQLDHWQGALLHPRARFVHWGALVQSRLALHQLDELCEDQRSAMQDWITELDSWSMPEGERQARELDLLRVRSRDLLEHIERVVRHVRQLEQGTETVVQMHFSIQGNRTNDIMRVLTVLTAIFLPLNLIAGIFGMNFEFLPLVHRQTGFWWAMAAMALIALALVLLFWRKRYLERSAR